MLKREITYEDFNGKMRTEVFYFNFSKRELLEFQIEQEDLLNLDIDLDNAGIRDVVNEIGKTSENNKRLIKLVQYFVLHAYGIKSEDGRRFEKSDELRKSFEDTAAYNQLWEDLATDDKQASNFVMGVFPRDMTGDIKKLVDEANAEQPKAIQEVPLPPRPPS